MDMDNVSCADEGVIQEKCNSPTEQQLEQELKKEVEQNNIEKKKLSHKQWRRYLKKIRRKNARQALARNKERQEKEEEQRKTEESKIESEAITKLKEQLEKEKEIRKEKEHQQWLQREKIALSNINHVQTNNKEEVVNIIDIEHEVKGDKKAESRTNPKQLLEAEMKKLEEQQDKIPEQRACHNPERPNSIRHLGDGNQTPNINQADDKNSYQSMIRDPNICSFFMKTGACKYGARCSRNHVRCEDSSTIMIPNFFQNARLEIPMINESCNDADIEYDELEMIQAFETFYDDVIEEFKTAGNVVMFKCCQNYVPHLRGNVYVQFSNPEHAMKALGMFNGRFYAGRQLSVELSPVSNWKSSICGMFLKKSCPRGKACNFLHVFRNPGNAYSNFDTEEVSKRINDGNHSSPYQSSIHRDNTPRRHHPLSRSHHSNSHSQTPTRSPRSHYSHSHSRSRSRSPRRRNHSREHRRSPRSTKYSSSSSRSSK